jgi:cytochrome c553
VIACAGAVLAACASAPATKRDVVRTQDGWSSLSWEQRHEQMTFVVLPNLAKLFQRFEGTADATLTCRTCHGQDADAVEFSMPRGLPALDPAHLPDRHSTNAREARIAAFMIDEVVPAFARTIEVPAERVTCFSCHPARSQ